MDSKFNFKCNFPINVVKTENDIVLINIDN